MKKSKLRIVCVVLFIMVIGTLPLFGKVHARIERWLISNDINRILKQEVTTHSQSFKDLNQNKGVQFFIQRDATQRAYFQTLSATNLQQAQELALKKPFTSMFTYQTTINEESYTVVLVIADQYPMMYMVGYSVVLFLLMLGILKTKSNDKVQLTEKIVEVPVIKKEITVNRLDLIDQSIINDYYVQMEQTLKQLHQAIGFTKKDLDKQQMTQLMNHMDKRIDALDHQVFSLIQMQQKEPQLVDIKQLFFDMLNALKRLDNHTIDDKVRIQVSNETWVVYPIFMRMLYLMLRIVRFELQSNHDVQFAIEEEDHQLKLVGLSRREVVPNELFEQLCLVINDDMQTTLDHYVIEDARLLVKAVHMLEGTINMRYHLGIFEISIVLPNRRQS